MSEAREPVVSKCGAAVRALMRRYAEELGDRADVQFVAHNYSEIIDLIPRNPRAAMVTVEHRPAFDEVARIGFVGGLIEPASDYSTPDWPGWIEWMDNAIGAVVAGRVVVQAAPGRRRVEIAVLGDEPLVIMEHSFPRGCLPLPGWRRRYQIAQFEPY